MGDAEIGKKIFIQRCAQCHTAVKGGKNKTGPNLFGIFDREAGKNPNYKYSDAVKNSGVTWNADVLEEFLTNPRQYVPGTKTTFPGMRSKTDRKNVIEYLKICK